MRYSEAGQMPAKNRGNLERIEIIACILGVLALAVFLLLTLQTAWQQQSRDNAFLAHVARDYNPDLANHGGGGVANSAGAGGHR